VHPGPLTVRVLDALAQGERRALFVDELRATLGRDAAPADVDAALRDLADEGAICIIDHAPPDTHLQGADLRIAAIVAADYSASLASAEDHWRSWLAQFLAEHRCS
jgi:hypothetical protein